MNQAFSFFLNAIKTILLSPFYLIYFVLTFLIGAINYVFGEVFFLLSGFKYGKKSENKYNKKLNEKLNKGGDQ